MFLWFDHVSTGVRHTRTHSTHAFSSQTMSTAAWRIQQVRTEFRVHICGCGMRLFIVIVSKILTSERRTKALMMFALPWRPPGLLLRAYITRTVGSAGRRMSSVRIMLKDGAHGQTGTKILLDAMSKDKVHLARFVLDALDGEIVDAQTDGAQTPLISSTLLPDSRARCKFMELLLQRGAGVNCQDGAGRTALSHACEKGHLDAVKVLVRNNADPELLDSWGNSALMYASAAGHAPVVEFLVRAFKRLGLQVDRRNQAGNSALEVVKFLGHAECVFALTHVSKKTREIDVDAQPRSSECERKVEDLTNKMEVLHTHDDALMHRPRQRMKKSRLSSMDSIEESETENDVSSSNLPVHLKTEDSRTSPEDSGQVHRSVFSSPRPGRHAPSALDILLTPIPSNRSEPERADHGDISDFSTRGFNESYYKKRCSLPTSVLSRAPPERTLVPARKSQTVRRKEGSPMAEPLELPEQKTSARTFSALSSKLFRRFTSPEFRKSLRDLQQSPALASARIPKSGSFPQAAGHPQVDSTHSIDSISAVKCEFDFPPRKPNS